MAIVSPNSEFAIFACPARTITKRRQRVVAEPPDAHVPVTDRDRSPITHKLAGVVYADDDDQLAKVSDRDTHPMALLVAPARSDPSLLAAARSTRIRVDRHNPPRECPLPRSRGLAF